MQKIVGKKIKSQFIMCSLRFLCSTVTKVKNIKLKKVDILLYNIIKVKILGGIL